MSWRKNREKPNMEVLNKKLEYSLSGDDIMKALNHKCNLISYNEIINYDNIYDLLGPYKKCVILYMNSVNYGHWTCVYEYNNKIIFFDSYGNKPDTQGKFTTNFINKEFNQNFPHLVKMMYNSGLPVEYNEYQLQRFKQGINTCGRWVCVRLLYPNYSVEEFKNIFKNRSLSPDIIICLLT